MQCGSTGLGKRALKLRFLNSGEEWKEPPTKPPEGALIIKVKSYDPVIWNVWVAIEPRDVLPMIRILFTMRTMAFLRGLLRPSGGKAGAEGSEARKE